MAQPAATFGDLLRRYRLTAGLTQEELAEKAQVSPRAISDLECGARNRPWRETIQLLADALTIAHERGLKHAIALALEDLGYIVSADDDAEAHVCLEESRRLYRLRA